MDWGISLVSWDTTGSVKKIMVVKTHNLSKYYGVTCALDNINLEVIEGEVLTIFGPNGAGKTTLIRVLASLTKPTSGGVSVLGYDLPLASQDLNRKIGVVTHQTFLYEHLTAFENLSFYAKMFDLPSPKEKISEVLEPLELYERKDALVSSLSGGLKQRLSIARAILHNPELLLLDEPYTGLDQRTAQKLKNVLTRQRPSRTIIVTTHNLQRGLEISDQIAIQVQGKIVYEEGVEKINLKTFEDQYFNCVGSQVKWEA